jgi:hypothetical protein
MENNFEIIWRLGQGAMTLSITTFIRAHFITTDSIHVTQYNVLLSVAFFIVTLSAALLSIVTLSVFPFFVSSTRLK